jgi:regulatory protein
LPRSSRPKPAGTAFDAGIRLLARRAHSSAELGRKLARRGYEADEVQSALQRLGQRGYLDDNAFADGLVRRRSVSRGPLALSAELAAKGVDRRVADAAVSRLTPGHQLEIATRLAERLYASGPRLAYREMLDRVGSKLVRRGFAPCVVREACRTVMAGTPPGDEA